MSVRFILIVFIIGALFVVFGAMFKLMHWPNASALLTIGLGLELLSGILVVFKLMNSKK
ncbi:gliding motility protein GldL [Flavobacterium sp. MK4S-17]|uniref:GldL-related protein n=1 Tax=Flavobacterium sp. MK4S-17 TaxID=2543737 RepID=UPI00135AFB34|nr:gliding motility protein GldL [Flavobacterium sp. MK4S-17]